VPYSQFTSIGKAKKSFGLNTIEGGRFLPVALEPIHLSATLQDSLAEGLPLATATGSAKAHSELIIAPVLLEVRKLLDRQISLFSGEDFTVDESVGLNGMCDFLLSRSPELLEIEAPAIVIVEAKKTDLKTGFGQCIAEMVAAQRFNLAKNKPVPTLYGCISNGAQWQFLKLEATTVTIDLTIYPLPPVEPILSMFVWMLKDG
jgi:hypothetical protein